MFRVERGRKARFDCPKKGSALGGRIFAILRHTGGGGLGLQVELPSHTEMEKVIAQIRGIIASRVVIEANRIEEVHVLAGLGRPVKQIVRDIETAIAAHFGYDVDYRTISVVQLDAAAEHEPTDLWPRLQSIRLERAGGATSVEVDIEVAGRVYSGRSEGSLSEGPGRVAALAVVEALSQFLGPECRVALDALVPSTVGVRQVVLAAVQLVAPGFDERCLGAALVESDAAEPAAKAVLTAVSRRLGFVAERRRKVGG